MLSLAEQYARSYTTPRDATVVATGKDAPTAQGASEFVRFFYSQIETAFQERDPSLLSTLSAPTCESCQQYVSSLTKLRDNNERVDGFRVSVLSVVSPALDAPTTARVDVIWSYEGAKRFDATGRQIREEPATRGIEELVDLTRTGGVWRVAEIERIRIRG